MKKCVLIILLAMAAVSTRAQDTLVGIWEGKMNIGVELRMVFHIFRDSAKNLTATMDSPDQGLRDIKASSFTVKDDSIYITIARYGASYAGRLRTDSTISGKYIQAASFPLSLKKVEKASVRVRPQTPVAPFPYTTQDVIYYNADKSITYGATITIPKGKGPFPAALLLTGSGQQNRDSEMMEHRPFAVIADHLTRSGYIVLRADDRQIGNTTGELTTATTSDFAKDAMAGLDYLKTRQEVDKKKLGLIGHSEGGMIAQIVAAERKDVYFVVMLAAPGVPILQLMAEQNRAMFGPMSDEYVTPYINVYTNIIKAVLASDSASVHSNIAKVVRNWVDTASKKVVVTTTGIYNEKTEANFVQRFAEQLNHPWFRYFLAYDPAPNIQKMTARVFAINGDKDVQVLSKSNLAAIEAALKKSRSKAFEVKELKGLNHLFQECVTCNVLEYGQLEQTFSPAVLDLIAAWIGKTVNSE